mmetsp:Transcript_27616/g.54289  ORF Transcript_27616/g.54289 Transcript_27616/m.54289 type:complete len:529 (+) Transcript_27616:39-1625(+)|eukprot:CAMPEP_0175162912 /NCGR_PEP_ID=MMETSP0087-20121206/25427_1 /TAXON_ID=136419 /ORGANISM="Unknown Unknown, Strain D1" /LENGTH=528 /DNA_ID=CAMNT_0016451497 /DNA_START=28 /DNA_END=1614 /DNA_ORIENTATION=-
MAEETSEVLNVQLDEDVKKSVYPQIKAKLNALLETEDEDDTTLLEYVTLLVDNKRAKTHIASDLEAFFGKESAASFTDWLWDLLLPYQISVPALEEVSGKEPKVEPERPDADEHRSRRDSRDREGQEDRDRRNSRSHDSRGRERNNRDTRAREREPRRQNMQSAVVIPERQERGRERRQPGLSSRLFASAMKQPEKKESRREHTTEREDGERRKRPARDEDEDQRRAEKRFKAVRDALTGQSRNRERERAAGRRRLREEAEAEVEAEKQEEQDEEENGSDGAVAQRKKVVVKKGEKPVKKQKFTITLTGLTSKNMPKSKKTVISNKGDRNVIGSATDQDQASKPDPPAPRAALVVEPANPTTAKLVKCVFWPNCTKGSDCPFHHPSELCSFFPNCRYGSTCLNIHPANAGPATRGRGGARGGAGTRGRGGVTSRGRGRGRGAFSDRGGRGGRGRGGGKGGGSNRSLKSSVCRFDTTCNNINCPFEHPAREQKERAFLGLPSDSSDQAGGNKVNVTPVAAAQEASDKLA